MVGQTYQIGEVAETVGLSLRTIRYYEEVGLVVPSGRSSGGFRLYIASDIDRLRLVKNMKPLDMSIEEMRDLFGVRDRLADSTTPAPDRRELVERLSMFASLADERCRKLREQLENAESISAKLRADIATARTPVRTQRTAKPRKQASAGT